MTASEQGRAALAATLSAQPVKDWQDRWVLAGLIETIKGIATRDMPLAYANMLLQGDPGTTIELSVVRVQRPEPSTVTLTRANIPPQPVETQTLTGQVGADP